MNIIHYKLSGLHHDSEPKLQEQPVLCCDFNVAEIITTHFFLGSQVGPQKDAIAQTLWKHRYVMEVWELYCMHWVSSCHWNELAAVLGFIIHCFTHLWVKIISQMHQGQNILDNYTVIALKRHMFNFMPCYKNTLFPSCLITVLEEN